MSENNKKTLTVKTGTLTVKNINQGSSGKLGLSSPLKNKPTHPSSKGKVVVVTKSPRGAKSIATNERNDGRTLTEAERQKRLEVLRQAEESRRKQEEIEKAIAAQRVSDDKVQDEPYESELQSSVAVEEESTEVESEDIVLKSSEDLRSLLSGDKIRNLDSIRRPKKKIEVEASTTDSPASKNEAAKAIKDKKTFFKAVEEKSFEEKDTSTPSKKYEDKWSSKKISASEVMMMDSEEGQVGSRRRSLASIRRAKDKARRKFEQANLQSKSQEKIAREVDLPDFITVQELSNRMSEKAASVIKSLMQLGIMATVNQTIDADTAEIVISELGHKVRRVTEEALETELLQKIEDAPESLRPRAPVVTVMGHVDHGKTSLLDALRATDVVSGEAGGITQHIGAYQVHLSDGKEISFLDTPGHEAFTAMRMRGAKVTDIVILVVSADDGIMPQTVEAISHSKAASVPIIVAINKIDKPDANPQKIKQELLSHGLIPEDLGGDILTIEVSAKQRINLDKLEEAILLQAELLELKANPDRIAEGAVVESKVDKGRGPVATVLVQKGTLNSGDIIVAGTASGRVRALINDKGKHVKVAGPSTPIEIIGLDSAPVAGDDFIVVKDEKTAKEIVSMRTIKERQKLQVKSKGTTLDQLFSKSGVKELSVIVKADVQGSVEAISQSLEKLSTDEITVRTIHAAVGGITESDVTLASASNSIIIGFNVRAGNQARDLAKLHGIDIRYYSIIYNLVDEIKAAMSGMLSPEIKEEITGYADVREVFNLSKYGKVAGCMVTEGNIKRGSHARILRDSVVIFQGKLKALKRFKDDVKEVATGFECGLSFENYEDIKVGDRVEAYEVKEEKRTI